MNDNANPAVRIPVWYWIVAVLAVLWMAFGVFAWIMDLMTDEATVESLSEAQRAIYRERPAWLFIAYGVAVFSGLAGAIALLLRKAIAVPAFTLSLATAIVQFGYMFVGMNIIGRLGAAQALPFPIVILVLAVLLLWLARHARKRGWIG